MGKNFQDSTSKMETLQSEQEDLLVMLSDQEEKMNKYR